MLVELGGEELLALIDGGLDHRVVIVGKGNLRPIGFEEILIDVESGTKALERRLQPLYRVLLRCLIETLVVHAAHAHDHADVAALGQERSAAPEPIEVQVRVQRGGFLPRLQDSIHSKHQRTSTAGISCLPRHSAA